MKIEIITPDRKVFEGEIKSVRVPGRKGSFQVLKDHAPIISTLENGLVLDCGCHQMSTVHGTEPGSTNQRKVIGFRRAGCPDE